MGKKKLLKKFFGKSSRKSKGANSSPVTSAVVAADQTNQGRPHPIADADNCAPVEHDPSSSPGSAAAWVNDAARSDSVTSGTVSTQSGGSGLSPGVGVKVEVEQPLAAALMEEASKNEPETTFDKVPKAEDENSELPPTTADLNLNAEVETDAPAGAASGMADAESEEKCMGVENKAPLVEALPAGIQTDAAADPLPERVDAASDENHHVRENKASGSREAISVEMKVVKDGESKGGGGEDVAPENQSAHDEDEGEGEGSGGDEVEKRNKKKWAEEKISRLDFSSCSKPTERLKVDVGEGLNAERRKWVEGLSTPKDQSLSSGNVKNVGKISDKWKAVEQSFQKKEKGPVPISRGNASKRWKAVEEERRRQSNPKATPVTPSPNKASEKKKAVEDMLQQLVKKEVSSPESLPGRPGRERLKSQKRFVLDVLEKQNDPKHFLDSKRDEKHSLDMGKESVGQKNGVEEIKIQMGLEGKGCDVANMVGGAEENEDKGNESLSDQAIPGNENTQD